jgi:hypothetical protein
MLRVVGPQLRGPTTRTAHAVQRAAASGAARARTEPVAGRPWVITPTRGMSGANLLTPFAPRYFHSGAVRSRRPPCARTWMRAPLSSRGLHAAPTGPPPVHAPIAGARRPRAHPSSASVWRKIARDLRAAVTARTRQNGIIDLYCGRMRSRRPAPAARRRSAPRVASRRVNVGGRVVGPPRGARDPRVGVRVPVRARMAEAL